MENYFVYNLLESVLKLGVPIFEIIFTPHSSGKELEFSLLEVLVQVPRHHSRFFDVFYPEREFF